MRYFAAGLTALTLLATLGGPVRADNIVVNGGFETGDFSGWATQGNFVLVAGGKNYGGFDFGGHGAHGGTYFAALGTVSSLGSISQTLATVAGQTYTLDFFVAGDGGSPNELKVNWGGTVVFDQTGIPNQGYVEHKLQLTATGPSTKLTFWERNDPGYLALDDVSVTGPGANGQGETPTSPEPASLALFGVGGLAMFGYARLRRRKPAIA